MRLAHRLAGGLAVAAVFAAPALAATYRLGDLSADHPWIRLAAPGAMTAAGYVTLSNRGLVADHLVGISSPAARSVTLHQSTESGGIMRMAPVKTVTIPPKGGVALNPGGYHLMISGFKAPLQAGQTVPVTLRFERGGPMQLEFAVKAAGESPGGAAPMDHMHMN